MIASPDAAGETAAETSQQERRSVERRYPSGAVVLIDDVAREHDAELLDLSEDGVGIWIGVALRRRSIVALRLPIAGRSGAIPIQASVVICQSAGAGVWRGGCRFHRRLSPTVLAGALR